jgi:hypothetical protein
MDVFLASYVYNKRKTENFETENNNHHSVDLLTAILIIWMIIASPWASAISWKCNSGAPFIQKIFYSVMASAFATWYLLFRTLGIFCSNRSIFD